MGITKRFENFFAPKQQNSTAKNTQGATNNWMSYSTSWNSFIPGMKNN
jgi:hypothetical protein